MKVCPNCQNPNVVDESAACPNCGFAFVQPQPQQVAQIPQAPQGAQTKPVDEYDHTDEFDAKDIAENKLYAMLVYLLGIWGIIIALLKKGDSAYLAFHLKQGIKLTIVTYAISFIIAVLCWTFIVPFVGGVALLVVFVIQIMLFIDVCNNKAKEPYIIRNIKFLD